MPFTPAHVAAVLPLMRGRPARFLVPSALAIGAMTPDLPLFLPRWAPVSDTYARTHSWSGLPTWDLVIGALAFVAWLALRGPLAELAPRRVRARWQPGRSRGGLVGAVAVAVSLVLGATTHVVWDGFTHGGRFGVRLVPWLAESTGGLENFKIAQYASGALGLAVVAWVGVQSLRRATEGVPADVLTPDERRRVVVVMAVVLAALVLFFLARVAPRFDDLGVELVAYLMVTRTIGSAVAVAMLWTATWHLVRRRRTHTPASVA